ncbi:MAG: sigma-70 family RNA polymerase sigma factor [Actinomycetota bacterium]|nr:sigma-70 family RNA polymerase sigma factor [Actinomycetota bacterium]
MVEPSDRVLARQAGLGDRAAFSQIFERHSESTFRYARHMLDGDVEAARDATQEAWTKVWTHVGSYRGEARLQTWLFQIVAREVLSSRRRRRPVSIDDSMLETRPGVSSDPAAAFANVELWEALTIALAELAWKQRACWLLRELEEMSYEEIAQVLNTNTTVVRGQLHRARQALALRMEAWQ